MIQLAFAHQYKKLNGMGNQVRLLAVVPILYKDISMAFLNYDTDNGAYQLPEKQGWYLLLILEGASGIFTTLRRHTIQKAKYFTDEVGQMVEIITPADR